MTVLKQSESPCRLGRNDKRWAGTARQLSSVNVNSNSTQRLKSSDTQSYPSREVIDLFFNAKWFFAQNSSIRRSSSAVT